METPVHCRASAYEAFQVAVRRLDRPGALLEAAVAISMHEMEHVRTRDVVSHVESLARRVRTRFMGHSARSRLAHLHAVLFDEEGFIGDRREPHHPRNSYLPAVLQTRRGLPITLSLLYKVVGERVGLDIRGISCPGHFLASVDCDGSRMIIDAHGGGRLLTEAEAFDVMETATGALVPRTPAMLCDASPHKWVARMLRNLQSSFALLGRTEDRAAILEMWDLLKTVSR